MFRIARSALKRQPCISIRPNFHSSSLLRFVSLTQASTAPKRQLKAESYHLPKDEIKEAFEHQNTTIPSELGDFELTRVIHGHTDLKIGITDRARDKLADIAKKDKNPETALRIQVESGGCHGFQYNLNLTTLSEALAKDDDLVVFQRSDKSSATVIFDELSLEILQDSKIDFTKELIGASFKVIDSPYTSTSCGCGASFDFDFDKLEEAKAKKA